MGNTTVRAAAVRAAAKRAERARRPDQDTARKPAEDTARKPRRTEPAAHADDTGRTEPVRRTAPAGTPSGRRERARLRRRPGALGAALAVLVALCVAATVLLGLRYRDAERTAQARTQAPAAAVEGAPVILSYDHRRLDRDFAAARRHLTGPFLDQYEKTTTTVVAPTAKKYRGVVKATVAKPPNGDATPAASVVSASPERVVVLLFMNQVTTSTQVTTPRLDLNRVRMTLVRTPQGWKVSAVDAL
ncbi:hypothetical protein [Streptomyces tritici]|uniref:hypothetical protein n=1 Tax=Streptomyces tritici TaxID=2054410 RepID=UPI003AEF328C